MDCHLRNVFMKTPVETSNLHSRLEEGSVFRLKERQLRYESHREFLTKCLNQAIVPNGFEIKWNLQLDANETILSKCEKIKKRCVFTIFITVN